MSSITIITLPNGITIETTNGGALAEALATIAAVPAVPAQAPKAPKAKAEAPAQAPEAEAPAPKAPKAPKATKAKGRTKEENKALYAEITGLTRAGRFTEARSMAEAAGWSTAAIDKAEAAGPKAPKATRAAKREAKAKAEAITEAVVTEAIASDAAAQVPAWHASRIVAASHRGLSGRLKAMLQNAAGDGAALSCYAVELAEAADACDLAAEALTGKAQESLLAKAATVSGYAAMASAMAKALLTDTLQGE